MPSTTPLRQDRWPGGDSQAIEFLTRNGYTLNREWTWNAPKPHRPTTPMERDALIYLIEEWDFGGLLDRVPSVGENL